MSNRYFLRIGALGRFPEIGIDSDQFQALKQSRLILTHALAIEEKYEIIISNFLELEQQAINVSVGEMVRPPVDYNDFFDIRLALNIRLVNLLTSVRLYSDQLISHLRACLPIDTSIKEKAKRLFSTEYDKSLEYRFMEALRNHVQHSDIPVHNITTGCKWIENNERLLEYSLYFSSKKEELEANPYFKKSVLSEMPDEVNLRAASRRYIESISIIHKQARELIEDSVSQARSRLEEARETYSQVYEGTLIGLHAYEYQDDQKQDEVHVLLTWDDVRLKLVKRNRELLTLSKRYVTSQAHNK